MPTGTRVEEVVVGGTVVVVVGGTVVVVVGGTVVVVGGTVVVVGGTVVVVVGGTVVVVGRGLVVVVVGGTVVVVGGTVVVVTGGAVIVSENDPVLAPSVKVKPYVPGVADVNAVNVNLNVGAAPPFATVTPGALPDASETFVRSVVTLTVTALPATMVREPGLTDVMRP